MAHTPVTADEFANLDGMDDWRYVDGSIRTTFAAGSFPAGGALIAKIADAAEAVNHHPDLEMGWPGHVGVLLTTHPAGGLTTADIDLAHTISELSSPAGAEVAQP
jgi:4a-hydroxytetrahydrobiopterin dehydratase